MQEPKYKRVLLKISGEALAGDKHFGLDFQVMGQVADVIKECVAMGVEIGVVIGGGNFWRGVKNGEGYIERTRADHMGMLATAMNCMAMADVLEQKGVDVRVQTALEIKEVAEPYIRQAVKNEAYDAAAIAALLQQRTEVLTDIPEKLDFFDALPEYDTELFVHKKSKSDRDSAKDMLGRVIPRFEALDSWEDDSILNAMVKLAEELARKSTWTSLTSVTTATNS